VAAELLSDFDWLSGFFTHVTVSNSFSSRFRSLEQRCLFGYSSADSQLQSIREPNRLVVLQDAFDSTSVFQLRLPFCACLNEMPMCFTECLVDFMQHVFPRAGTPVFTLIGICCFRSTRGTERIIFISSSSV
jgi:hypothetical protein